MKKKQKKIATVLALCGVLTALVGVIIGQTAAGKGGHSAGRRELLPEVHVEFRTPVSNERIFNNEATVPPQCYTKTEGRHNPCYTCHQMYDRRGRDRLNQLDDGSLQGGYAFSDEGLTNHYTNLFIDRTHWLEAIDDDDIQTYVTTENYSKLASRLKARSYAGFIPDLKNYHHGAKAFDARGLALDKSGWVAIKYKPFPGTFWPTNGSTDDVLVRLPAKFRSHKGKPNPDIYFINLTLIELTIKGISEAPIWPIDEAALGLDIDGDGALTLARSVATQATYLGDASDTKVEFEQFPQGTELMHSVRYLGLDEHGRTVVPARMKELRYMRKVGVLSRDTIESRYAGERKEKSQGNLPHFIYRGDEGFDNKLGWHLKGFIEDYDGELRPQSLEEGLFCMGCHSSIGTTIDSTFSFARKLPGENGFGYIDLLGMSDAPSIAETKGEILRYLERAGGGSEFRENDEMRERWFREDGTVDAEKIKRADVYTLVTPSARRALDLNKAYTHIVRHQSFINGRDATWTPAKNVFASIDTEIAPLHRDFRHYGWDLRLNWAEF